MEKPWSELTREEKRDKREADYLAGKGIKFRDARAEKFYKERARRMTTTTRCEEADRVPVSLHNGHFPAYYAGYDFKTVMYDVKKLRESWVKFVEDFYEDMDGFMGAGMIGCGRAMDILDAKNSAWPGHGLPDTAISTQFIEGQYMKSDEYDALFKDPADFAFRVLMPRMTGAAEGLGFFPPLSALVGMPMALSMPFSNPAVRNSFRKLIEAGELQEQWAKETRAIEQEMVAMGFPPYRNGMGLAPFDVIGNYLRGTKGIAMDMYRQPEKLLEAVNMVTGPFIERTIANMNAFNGRVVSFPLHRGDDTFMSRKQFEKFYWPSLKKVIDSFIEEGICVNLFAEGAYNQRLDYIGDFPKGWVTWEFDKTDMAAAKKAIGDRCCIGGNVPGSAMLYGTPKDVKEICLKLIEACAPGGGFILAQGAATTECKNPDNYRALMAAVREAGIY